MARKTVTGLSQGTPTSAEVSMSTARAPVAASRARSEAPFTKDPVDTTGPTWASSPRRRRAAATRGAEPREAGTAWPRSSRTRSATTSAPGARPSTRRAGDPRDGDRGRPYLVVHAAGGRRRPAQAGPGADYPRRGVPGRDGSRLHPERGQHQQPGLVRGVRRPGRSWWVPRHGSEVAAQGHYRPHQAVQVIVDAEVPRESRAGEPRLIPGAIRLLRGGEELDTPPGRLVA